MTSPRMLASDATIAAFVAREAGLCPSCSRTARSCFMVRSDARAAGSIVDISPMPSDEAVLIPELLLLIEAARRPPGVRSSSALTARWLAE